MNIGFGPMASSDLYLILHKVRGEPAFDVAMQHEIQVRDDGTTETFWIIPTSGHRAYPFWTHPLNAVLIEGDRPTESFPLIDMPLYELCPPDLRDHYAASEPIAKPSTRRTPISAIEDFIV